MTKNPKTIVKDCTFYGPTINEDHLEVISAVADAVASNAMACRELASALNVLKSDYVGLKVT